MTFIDNKFLKPIMFMERSRKMKLFNKFSKKQKITFISVLFILIISTVYLIWQKNNQLLTFVKDPILEINHEFDYQKIIKNLSKAPSGAAGRGGQSFCPGCAGLFPDLAAGAGGSASSPCRLLGRGHGRRRSGVPV